MAVALDEVNKHLWTHIELRGDLVMDMNAAVDHFFGVPLENRFDIFQLCLCHYLLRLLGPLLTPDYNALVE